MPAVLVLEGVKYCREYSVFPNNSSKIGFDRFKRSSGAWVSAVSGCSITTGVAGAYKADFSPVSKDDESTQLNISADRSNSLYGASNTVQPKTLRSYCLIRYE